MKARLSKLTMKIDIAKYKGQAIAGGNTTSIKITDFTWILE